MTVMPAIPQVTLPSGETVPQLGQGTWHMGEDRHQFEAEVSALQLGIDLGLTLIDTAEMYGEGGAEKVVGQAIAGRREEVVLVSKVYPHNASRAGIPAACERSLRRLRTDRLDLYLLHWRGSTPLSETVEAFERLRAQGKVRAWGVSNFDVDDLQELPGACAANQVLYNLDSRGIEFDLLPWCQARAMPVMAYSPVGQGGALLRHPALRQVAAWYDATPAQVALAWALRQPGLIAIPKALRPRHVRTNAAAANLRLSEDDLRQIDAVLPPPNEKQPLVIW